MRQRENDCLLEVSGQSLRIQVEWILAALKAHAAAPVSGGSNCSLCRSCVSATTWGAAQPPKEVSGCQA